MSNIIKNWDSKAKRRLDICSSMRGGIESVISEEKRVGSLLDLNDKDLLLDVGCGDGLITNRLALSVQKAFGIDISSELLLRGNREARKGGGTNTVYLNSEASRIPFKDNSFDITVSLSIFHYFPDFGYANQVMDELVRVTKPSGRILITEIPSVNTVWYRFWRVIRNRGVESETTDFVEFEKMSFSQRLFARMSLFSRRFTGKRVDSDEWLWYEKKMFKSCGKEKFRKVEIFPSKRKGMANYRFDVLFSNY